MRRSAITSSSMRLVRRRTARRIGGRSASDTTSRVPSSVCRTSSATSRSASSTSSGFALRPVDESSEPGTSLGAEPVGDHLRHGGRCQGADGDVDGAIAIEPSEEPIDLSDARRGTGRDDEADRSATQPAPTPLRDRRRPSGVAQWRSSTTTTSGERRAALSTASSTAFDRRAGPGRVVWEVDGSAGGAVVGDRDVVGEQVGEGRTGSLERRCATPRTPRRTRPGWQPSGDRSCRSLPHLRRRRRRLTGTESGPRARRAVRAPSRDPPTARGADDTGGRVVAQHPPRASPVPGGEGHADQLCSDVRDVSLGRRVHIVGPSACHELPAGVAGEENLGEAWPGGDEGGAGRLRPRASNTGPTLRPMGRALRGRHPRR